MELKHLLPTEKANQMAGVRDKYKLRLKEPLGANLLRNLVVWVQLPGVGDQELDVSLAGNVLTIKEAETLPLDISSLVRPEIVGPSCGLNACLNAVVTAARSDECVLICGETGTGKELFARAIHQNSRRADERFVVVDCRSIPESIAEKLLFGQQQAISSAPAGLVPQAEYGTLFLDEVGDLPPATQKLFQKLLKNKTYKPVGSVDDVAITFRLIVATNRDLDKLVTQGKFSRDLLSLLQPLLVEVPPLRERLEDIDPLTDFFMQRYCRSKKMENKDRSPEFMDLLEKYPWPGNVRELENSLEQALLAAKNKKTLFPKDLPAHIRVQVMKSAFDKKKRLHEEEPRETFFGGLFVADNPL